AGVDEPIWHRPLDLLVSVQLVRLAIAIVVVVLARTYENVDGNALEPRLTVFRLGPARRAEDARGLRASLGLREHEQPLTLAIACARSPADRLDDSLDDLVQDRLVAVVAHHAPKRQRVPELHGPQLPRRA